MSCSVHDSHLVSFEVNSIANRIILHTVRAYGEEPHERTDIVFDGVIDHHFRNPLLPSIIFGVERVNIQAILDRDEDLIREGHRTAGWPSFWRASAEEMVEAIQNAGCGMFEVSSSYGLSGWVAAASCAFIPAGNTAEPRENTETKPDPGSS